MKVLVNSNQIIAGYHDEVVSIRRIFNEYEATVQTLSTKMEQVKRCIEALEIHDTGESFISAAEETFRTEKTSLADELASRF